MTYNSETFDKLVKIFDKIDKIINRKNASRSEDIVQAREYILIHIYNIILKQVKYCFAEESNDKQEVEDSLEKIKERLGVCLETLESGLVIPIEKFKQIIIIRPDNIKNKELEIEAEIDELDVNDLNENIDNNNKDNNSETENKTEENNKNTNPSTNTTNTNKIIERNLEANIKMDATKVIETLNRIVKEEYDGEPLQLDSFINKVELAKTIIKNEQPEIFASYIKSRLKGKALESARSGNTVDEILELLKSEIKPESSRVLENRLTSLRMNSKNKADFAKEVEETSEMLRLALIAEKIPNQKAKDMVLQKTIETCNNNAKSDRIKSILSAKTFKSTAEIVSELFIQLDTCKLEFQINAMRISNPKNNYKNIRNFRGNNRYMSNRGYRNNNFRRNYNINRNYNNQNRNYNRNFNRNGNYNNNNRNYNRGNFNNNRNNNNRGNYNNNNRNSQNIRFLREANTNEEQNQAGTSRQIYQNQD